MVSATTINVQMRKSIVWFKTDLRLHDNKTLIGAINNSDEVLPVYCFDDSHYATTKFGFKKTGNFRAQFLLESLQDLESNLKNIGSGLLILRGNQKQEIARIAAEYVATKVYAKKEVAFEEKNIEAELKKNYGK